MLHRVSMPYDTNVWYHVTDASNLQSIRDHGLTPYNRGISEKVFPRHSVVESGVYLSPNIAGAQSFATNHNANKDKKPNIWGQKIENYGIINNPIILQITNIDKTKLIPDPEAFNFFISDEFYNLSTPEEIAEHIKNTNYFGSALFPQFMIKYAKSILESIKIDDYSGSIMANTILNMPLKERDELNNYWKNYHSNEAFVYLGTIPAQNISIASYGLYGEEPSETDIMANAYDDYQDEFAENYRFQPMFSRTANRPAQEFAISQHQQFGKPYDMQHIPEVVSIVSQYTNDQDVISAAWLHDVVEDTGVSIDQIGEMYGDRVAQIVWAVTDEEGANRIERKEKTLPKTAQNPDAALIKLADRVANVTASMNDERRLEMYRKEYPAFKSALQPIAPYEDMWNTLDHLLGN